MTADSKATPPPVMWAQRRDIIFLTYNVECTDPEIKFERDSVYFKGVCGPEKKLHELTIPLHNTIVPEKSLINKTGRLVEVTLYKEVQDSPFWPALTSDKKKHHWLKVDFNKWQDEDDSGEEGHGEYESMLRNMGAASLPNMEGDAGLGDDGADFEDDSDDENLPDLE